jgi:hypothetical protein
VKSSHVVAWPVPPRFTARLAGVSSAAIIVDPSGRGEAPTSSFSSDRLDASDGGKKDDCR